MDTHPVAAQAFGEDRRAGAQTGHPLARPGIVSQRDAQVGMQVLRQGNTGEEVDLLRRQLRHQAIDEVVLDVTAAGLQLLDGEFGPGAPFDGGHGQLQPQRPTLGEFMQQDPEIDVEAVTETTAEHGNRFIDVETQGLQAQAEKYPPSLQFGSLQVEATTRGHQHPQIRRRIVQQIGQGNPDGGLRQQVDLVEHECHLAAQVGHLRQPFRQVPQGIAAVHRLIGRTGKCLPTAGHQHGRRQPLDEAHAVVAVIQGQPGDHRAARQEFPAPLGQ
ncbi:hypothetical protein D9M72_411450 [compost metagenome]